MNTNDIVLISMVQYYLRNLIFLLPTPLLIATSRIMSTFFSVAKLYSYCVLQRFETNIVAMAETMTFYTKDGTIEVSFELNQERL